VVGREGEVDVQLAGRVALVTGGSSGIGRATCVELARRGCRLVVHGRDAARTAEVARLVGGAPVVADLTEPGAVDRLTQAAAEVHGRVDVLVANAGAGLRAPFTSTSPTDLERLVTLDLVAPIRLVRALLPAMVERGSGHVVLVSSVAGRTGVAGEAGYAAAKAGLDLLAESVRLELGGTGVGMTVVLPGLVDTPFHAGRAGPARRVPSPVPPERVGRAIAEAVADGRSEVWVPGWLRLAAVVRALTPGLFRRLSARLGEPVRSTWVRRDPPSYP
jgi:NAD(P)-dependent dehydrogenase (short-subunit alcohol dehydrogenase family)